jgi:hypothetical protein
MRKNRRIAPNSVFVVTDQVRKIYVHTGVVLLKTCNCWSIKGSLQCRFESLICEPGWDT